MKRHIPQCRRWSTIAILVAVVAAMCMPMFRPDPVDAQATLNSQATLTVLTSPVEVQRATGNRDVASSGATVVVGDRIFTGSGGSAKLTFFQGTEVDIAPETEIMVQEMTQRQSGASTVSFGQAVGSTVAKVASLLNPASRVQVSTQSAVAVVRGTELEITVTKDQVQVFKSTSGSFDVIAGGQTQRVKQGQVTVVPPPPPPPVAAGERSAQSVARGQAVAVPGAGERVPMVPVPEAEITTLFKQLQVITGGTGPALVVTPPPPASSLFGEAQGTPMPSPVWTVPTKPPKPTAVPTKPPKPTSVPATVIPATPVPPTPYLEPVAQSQPTAVPTEVPLPTCTGQTPARTPAANEAQVTGSVKDATGNPVGCASVQISIFSYATRVTETAIPTPVTAIPTPVTAIPTPVTAIPPPATAIPPPATAILPSATAIPPPATAIPPPVTAIPTPATAIPPPATAILPPVTAIPTPATVVSDTEGNFSATFALPGWDTGYSITSAPIFVSAWHAGYTQVEVTHATAVQGSTTSLAAPVVVRVNDATLSGTVTSLSAPVPGAHIVVVPMMASQTPTGTSLVSGTRGQAVRTRQVISGVPWPPSAKATTTASGAYALPLAIGNYYEVDVIHGSMDLAVASTGGYQYRAVSQSPFTVASGAQVRDTSLPTLTKLQATCVPGGSCTISVTGDGWVGGRSANLSIVDPTWGSATTAILLAIGVDAGGTLDPTPVTIPIAQLPAGKIRLAVAQDVLANDIWTRRIVVLGVGDALVVAENPPTYVLITRRVVDANRAGMDGVGVSAGNAQTGEPLGSITPAARGTFRIETTNTSSSGYAIVASASRPRPE